MRGEAWGQVHRPNRFSTLPVASSQLLRDTGSISFPQVELASFLHCSLLETGYEAGVAPWVTRLDQLSILGLQLPFDNAPQSHLIGGGGLNLHVYHGAPSSEGSMMLSWAGGTLPGMPEKWQRGQWRGCMEPSRFVRNPRPIEVGGGQKKSHFPANQL